MRWLNISGNGNRPWLNSADHQTNERAPLGRPFFFTDAPQRLRANRRAMRQEIYRAHAFSRQQHGALSIVWRPHA